MKSLTVEEPSGKNWYPLAASEPTKLAEHTSKFCPHCKDGKKRKRTRRYGRSIPVEKEKLNPDYPPRLPRIRPEGKWWNFGFIRFLIEPEPGSAWFECWEVATCPRCGPERVKENDYSRQFGRIRRFKFCLVRSLKKYLGME